MRNDQQNQNQQKLNSSISQMASIHIVNDASDPLGSSDTCHGATGMTILSWTNGRPQDLRGGPWLCLLVRDGQNYYPLRD